MDKYYLDKNALAILNVIIICISVCIIVVIKYLLYYKLAEYNAVKLAIEIVAAGLVTIYVVWLLIILPMWYRSVCYTLSKDELRINSGVVLRKLICVKLADVQYIETLKVPIFYKASLNFLLINISGKRVVLKYLSNAHLEELYNKLIQFGKDRKSKA